MLQKCLNPGCTNSFRYMHEGRLLTARRPRSGSVLDALLAEDRSKPPELFWLCERCSAQFEVEFIAYEVRISRITHPQTTLAKALA
jgi:hypothetical protein